MEYINALYDWFVTVLWPWMTTNVWPLIVLIPIGVLGIVRWIMWLVRAFIALFYSPYNTNKAENLTATIVTPVYEEDPVMFRRALESWIANKPERIIAVIDITDQTSMQIAREYTAVEVMEISEPGKRPALAIGVDATTTDITVLVDSDVIWDRDVLKKLKMPFSNKKIGGVGTRQHMYPTNGQSPTIWERIADIFLDIRYSLEVPSTVVLGNAVSCLSGRTAAYRTQILKDMREPFLNETFNGRQMMSGDDKCYTNLLLQSGYRTYNQLNAHVYSTFKPTFNGFMRQRVRWARNSLRSDFKALWQGWVWKYPFLAITLIERFVSSYTLLVGPLILAVILALGYWQVALSLVIWWLISRFIKLLPHFWRRPGDILLLPIYIPLSWLMSLVKTYSLFTINRHEWLTRSVSMVNNRAVRVARATQS